MLRSRPAVVVHHHGDDGKIVTHHRVEFGDGETDGAVTDQAKHRTIRMGHLSAHSEPQPESDGSQEPVRDIASGVILANDFVHPDRKSTRLNSSHLGISY